MRTATSTDGAFFSARSTTHRYLYRPAYRDIQVDWVRSGHAEPPITAYSAEQARERIEAHARKYASSGAVTFASNFPG